MGPNQKAFTAVVCLSAWLAGCSGGNEAAEPMPVVPLGAARLLPAYEFTLSDNGSESDRLVATADFGDAGPVNVVIDSRIEPTLGRFDYATGIVTFTAGAVAVESDFGFVVVDIADPVVLTPGGAPENIRIELTMSIEGRVSLDFGSGAVTLRRGAASLPPLTIDEFEQLLATRLDVPVWQHQSALAWAALDLLRHLVVASAETFEQIDRQLESATSIDTMCEPIPVGPPPGTGIVTQGLRRLTWLGAGTIRSGDEFMADYMDCWRSAADGRGVLFDGAMRFGGLAVTVGGDTITEIGFRAVGSAPGGILPDDLTVAATRTQLAPTLDVPTHLRFVLNNGIRLTFAAP